MFSFIRVALVMVSLHSNKAKTTLFSNIANPFLLLGGGRKIVEETHTELRGKPLNNMYSGSMKQGDTQSDSDVYLLKVFELLHYL